MHCFVSCSRYIYSLHLLWDVAGLYSWWSPICPMVHAMNHWIWCTQCVAIEVTKDTNNKKSIIVMAASKQFLSYHLFESPWNLESSYLVGSSLEIVMAWINSLHLPPWIAGTLWLVPSDLCIVEWGQWQYYGGYYQKLPQRKAFTCSWSGRPYVHCNFSIELGFFSFNYVLFLKWEIHMRCFVNWQLVWCLENMIVDERGEMPTCILVEIVHNKWLQQSRNNMTCLYTAIVDDMICTFMRIAIYKSWSKGGSTGKGPSYASLKLKVPSRYGGSKLLADAMKFYPGT